MMNPIKKAALQIALRSERYEPEHLAKTFVDVGSLDEIVSNRDHQVIYGRRGTGKTHLFKYKFVQWNQAGDIAIYIDLRSLGSNGGLYNNAKLPIAERASRLLADFLGSVQYELVKVVVERSHQFNLSVLGPILDEIADAVTEVKVSGDLEYEGQSESKFVSNCGGAFGVDLTKGAVTAKLDSSEKQSDIEKVGYKYRNPDVAPHIHFGRVSKCFQRFVEEIGKSELIILIDEWAEIPPDIQPYLADMIKRCLFHVSKITCKIAGIAQRCKFTEVGIGWRIGFEPGADAGSVLNLDEYMVFENDKKKAIAFFSTLISRHIKQLLTEQKVEHNHSDRGIILELFTEVSFEEFVVASEGIPRDALHTLQQLVQNAGDDKIQKTMVPKAARSEFQRTKQRAIDARSGAYEFLNFIYDKVIGDRRARAFLVESNHRHALIDYLYDERVLHIIKESVSSAEFAGKRYTVYCIDYGCYAELANTTRFPTSLLGIEIENGITEAIDVPRTDYRSIRRAILDLSAFENAGTSGVQLKLREAGQKTSRLDS